MWVKRNKPTTNWLHTRIWWAYLTDINWLFITWVDWKKIVVRVPWWILQTTIWTKRILPNN